MSKFLYNGRLVFLILSCSFYYFQLCASSVAARKAVSMVPGYVGESQISRVQQMAAETLANLQKSAPTSVNSLSGSNGAVGNTLTSANYTKADRAILNKILNKSVQGSQASAWLDKSQVLQSSGKLQSMHQKALQQAQEKQLQGLINQQIEQEHGGLILDEQEVAQYRKQLSGLSKSARSEKLNEFDIFARAQVLDVLNPTQANMYLNSVDAAVRSELVDLMSLQARSKLQAEQQIIANNQFWVKQQQELSRLKKIAQKQSDLSRRENLLAGKKLANLDATYQAFLAQNQLVNNAISSLNNNQTVTALTTRQELPAQEEPQVEGESRMHSWHILPIGFVAALEFMFSLADEEKNKSFEEQEADTRAKLYAAIAANQDMAIGDGQDAIEPMAEALQGVVENMNNLPQPIQELLKALPELKVARFSVIKEELKKHIDMLLSVNFKEKIYQLLPYLKISVQSFAGKGLLEIERIIRLHVQALEDQIVKVHESADRGVLLLNKQIEHNLQALKEVFGHVKSTEKMYYVLAVLKNQANVAGSNVSTGLHSVLDFGRQYVNGQSLDNVSNSAVDIAAKGKEYVKIHAQEIVRRLQRNNVAFVTMSDLEKELPADIVPTSYMLGFVQARLNQKLAV